MIVVSDKAVAVATDLVVVAFVGNAAHATKGTALNGADNAELILHSTNLTTFFPVQQLRSSGPWPKATT